MFSYFVSQKRVSGYLRLYVPALVQLGSLQQQDRYIPPFFFPPFQELVFRGRIEEGEGDGDDMTRAQIFLGPFGCGPKIGGDRAKARLETGRSSHANASSDRFHFGLVALIR